MLCEGSVIESIVIWAIIAFKVNLIEDSWGYLRDIAYSADLDWTVKVKGREEAFFIVHQAVTGQLMYSTEQIIWPVDMSRVNKNEFPTPHSQLSSI